MQARRLHRTAPSDGDRCGDRCTEHGFVKAIVTVMLKPGVLDPQGRAIGQALHHLGFTGVGEVRAGKVIELDLAETDAERARAQAEDMARRLLANTVIESFRVEVVPAR
jgi:phosphoribosylformylglycinamidine synthase PurS subunit